MDLRIGLFLFVTTIIPIITFLAAGFVRTYQIQHDSQQKQFLKGSVPALLPNGPYKGRVDGKTISSWRGKSLIEKR